MSKIAALILAAGESKRFGSLKQLAPIGKHTLVSLAVHNSILGGAVPIVVLGYKWRLIEKSIGIKCKVVINNSYKKGQLSSIVRGIKAVPDQFGAFLIYPCDYPLITADDIEKLISDSRKTKKTIVALSCGKRLGHPVLISSKLKDEFLSLSLEQTARDVIYKDIRRVHRVNVRSKRIFMDIDTKEDYHRLIRYAR